jgi:hypothetical protein
VHPHGLGGTRNRAAGDCLHSKPHESSEGGAQEERSYSDARGDAVQSVALGSRRHDLSSGERCLCSEGSLQSSRHCRPGFAQMIRHLITRPVTAVSASFLARRLVASLYRFALMKRLCCLAEVIVAAWAHTASMWTAKSSVERSSAPTKE